MAEMEIKPVEKPLCQACTHWQFIHHITDADLEVQWTVGECRIRSINNEIFPERNHDEWCSEHEPIKKVLAKSYIICSDCGTANEIPTSECEKCSMDLSCLLPKGIRDNV